MTSSQSRSSINTSRGMTTSTGGSTLADILERVLDKGIVIAGDVSVTVGSTELLSIRIRLLIASVDKAKEMGINWWENDPYLSSRPAVSEAEVQQQLLQANQQLLARIESLETELRALKAADSSQESTSEGSE